MNYVTHNERETLTNEINGTGFIGAVDASYKEICSLFGKPMRYEQSGKADVMWVVKFSDDTVASIYNWKDGRAYLGDEGLPVDKIKQWHVGGHVNSAQTLVQIAIDLKREEEEKETESDPFEGAFSIMENLAKTKGESYAALVEVTMLTMKRKQLMDMVIDLLDSQTDMPKRVKKILEEMDTELCVRTISRACHASGIEFGDREKANELMEWAAKVVSQEVDGIKEVLKQKGK